MDTSQDQQEQSLRADRLVLVSVGLSGLLFALLGIPLILEWIGPNRAYGFRTEKTLSDPSIWYAANRASGWGMSIAGVLILLGTWVLWARRERSTPGVASWLALGLFAVALVGALAYGIFVLHRL